MPVSLQFLAETGSTNADMIAALARGETVPEGHWLVTDRQVSGRGRQGRPWIDAPGNFMGSTVVRFGPQDPPAPSLTFVASLAVYEAVVPHLSSPAELRLKWPNDVMLGDAKLCGILLEREGRHAVVGIGVNLAGSPMLEDRGTRSLAQYGPPPSRDAFAGDLAASFERELDRWRQYGIERTLSRWQAAAYPPGTRLSVHDGSSSRISGVYEGLEGDGALLLRLDDGRARVIHAGDVLLEER